MSKNLLIVIGVVLVLGFGGIYLFSSRGQNVTSLVPDNNATLEGDLANPESLPDQESVVGQDLTIQDDLVMDEADSQSATQHGQYLTYSQQAFAAAANKKRILFFHANWCPTCKVANQDLEKNLSQIPEGVVIFKTDYDTQKELKKKYVVTYQHTFVQVDSKGDLVTKWNGGSTQEILGNIK